MLRFVLRRLGMVIPTFIGITVLAFALIQARTFDAIERGDGQIDFLAAGAVPGVHRQLGQAAHVAHIVCGQPHGTGPPKRQTSQNRPVTAGCRFTSSQVLTAD